MPDPALQCILRQCNHVSLLIYQFHIFHVLIFFVVSPVLTTKYRFFLIRLWIWWLTVEARWVCSSDCLSVLHWSSVNYSLTASPCWSRNATGKLIVRNGFRCDRRGTTHGWMRVDINTLRTRQNGRHFADDPFKRIFLNETIAISIKISLNFFPKGPINIIPALV